MLEDLHTRLAGVVIERLDWSAILTRYDSPRSFFYLDPPYWGCEDDYGKAMFAASDFARMADMLRAIKGTFLMSINDVPPIRQAFAAFRITPVQTSYTIGKTKSRSDPVSELLISNFEVKLGWLLETKRSLNFLTSAVRSSISGRK
ncbi:MAG: DNA adenine methylase [Sulfitobacter sp.]